MSWPNKVATIHMQLLQLLSTCNMDKSELGCSLSVKYTLNFSDLLLKKNIPL